MQHRLLGLLFVIPFTCSILLASVVSPPEGNAIGKLESLLSIYSIEHGRLPDDWSDLLQYDPDLIALKSYFRGEENLDDLYSFIPERDRSLFKEGQLVLIRHKPMKWPETWNGAASGINQTLLDPDKLAEWERLKNRNGEIRYLIYVTEQRTLKSEWWHEDKVQEMLAETGLKIPPPAPYHAPHQPLVEKFGNTSALASPVVAAESIPDITYKTLSTRAATPDTRPAESSNPLWWIIGLIILAAGAVFITRMK